MEDVERVFFTLDSLPGRIRWLVEQAPTDLEPVWPYGGCGVEACTALAHFLKPCTRLDRARRIERVELGSRVAAADNELRDCGRRVRSGINPIKRRPKRRNEVIASALSHVARQIDYYLQCRPALRHASGLNRRSRWLADWMYGGPEIPTTNTESALRSAAWSKH